MNVNLRGPHSSDVLSPRSRRLLGLGVLVGLLGGCAVGFGSVTPNPAVGDYPNEGSLAVNPDGYVNEYVQVTGTVVQTDPVVIEDTYSVWVGDRYRRGTIRLHIVGLDRSVHPGQSLQVYGTVRPDGSVQARTSVSVRAHKQLYMYVVSALAGLWVLLRLVRGWTGSAADLALYQRASPVTLGGIRRLRSGDDTDA